MARATQVLLSNGYRPRNSMSDAQQAAVRRQSCELGFARDDGTRLDLHWDLMPPFFSVSLDHRALWQRRETVSVGGATVPALATEDLLLFLCVHGTKHLWARLQWLCDVAELQRRSADLDIATLLTRARALGAERMVLLALALTADVLDAPVADGVRRRAQQDRNVSALATQVRARWFRHAALTPIDPRELHLFRLRARERWRDRWRYLRLAVAPGPADLTWLRLPDALHLLYYVLRPIRLAVRYGVRRRPVR